MVANKPTDWYATVPKDFAENLRYRRKLRDWGRESEDNARMLWLACSRDLLFWINAFVWTYDASGTYGTEHKPSKLPFITYPYQDDGFLELDACIAREDALVEKSRDMGASWIAIAIFDWHLVFHPDYSFLMVSRKEALVDKPSDPKCLFWKLDFINKHLPGFMCPPNILPGQKNRTKLHVHNELNGSTIDGESTTGDVARGDRRAAILLDEFAAVDTGDDYDALYATQAATKCRIFNSTPKGASNAFAHVSLVVKPKKIRFHWSQMPWKRAGLYTADMGGEPRLKLLDEDFKHPAGYAFVLDGKVRSPWYDEECKRARLDSIIAQEQDIDYLGSGSQFFSQTELARVKAEFVRPPQLVGELEFDGQFKPTRFVESKTGRLSLWLRPDDAGEPPRDRQYVLGADVSQGTGASNSVLVVGDKKTGAKVAELVSPYLRPDQLADQAVALARWFAGDDGEPAFMIWEANGPGAGFGSRVRELGFSHFFYRTDDESIDKTPTKKPGYWTTKGGKEELLRAYGRAIVAGDFIERSAETVAECGEFIYGETGKVVHAKSITSLDPSGAKENHGDRVTASAVCWRGMKDVGAVEVPTEPVALPGSLAERMQAAGMNLMTMRPARSESLLFGS